MGLAGRERHRSDVFWIRCTVAPMTTTDGEPLHIPLNELYDTLTHQIIAETVRPGTIGIDVGAHIGELLRSIVAAAPEGRHVAVEPIPGLAAVLRAEFPTVSVHEVALAADSGVNVEFHHVVSNPSYSGLLERRYDRPNETVELIQVKTARLDDIVPEHEVVSLIKIDVEGGELGVLQGSSRILSTRPVVVFEHGLGASDHYGSTPSDIWQLFDSASMRISLLDAFLSGGPSLSEEELNRQFYDSVNYYFVAHE